MCGIAGIAGNLSNRELVSSMLRIMRHRGPDSEGFYLSDKFSLGHCRLSIIDTSGRAKQPFVSIDNTVAVAVNGEIYNFKDLKKPLQDKGHQFKSDSDCEVVLHAYIEYGLDFITKLNGMFAISIWDDRKKELFLIRDRLGIKPLYYANVKNSFIFASEIKALALCDEIDLALDLQSFAEYLAFENYFSNRTMNENIKLVEPGQIVTFSCKDNSLEKKYFWQPRLGDSDNKHDSDVYNKYLKITEASVNRHLISDVSLGSYLSAGIDSSSVVYWACKKIGPALRTYSGFFGIKGFFDEATQAGQTATGFGCLNKQVEITPEDFVRDIRKILWHLDEPKVGMGVFSQYVVARAAAKEVKVILTGHGGDELFAGYPVFKAVYGKKNILGLMCNSSFRELLFFMYFSVYPHIRKEAGYFIPNIFSLSSFNTMLNKEFRNELIKKTNIFQEPEALKKSCKDEYQRLTLTYLKFYLPSLFNVEDKISMAFSLESRTPFCDNEMLDFALSIPLAQKLAHYELKHIPKTSMKGKLPSALYKLPKRGFPTPLRLWFKHELKDYIRSFIFDNINSIPMFNREAVEKTVYRYQRSKINSELDEIAAHKIWILFNLVHYFSNQKNRYRIGEAN